MGSSHKRRTGTKTLVQAIEQEPAQNGASEEIALQTLERALQETRERFESFISTAGHELRTPLTTIKGNAQLALRRLAKIQRTTVRQEPIDKEALMTDLERLQQPLDYIVYRVDMQDRMISDLLDVSRIQSGKLAISARSCNLRLLVQNVVNTARQQTPERQIHLNLPAEEEIPIKADPERVEQAINIFLSNALKFSTLEQQVEVCLTLEENQGQRIARLQVQDHGTGIPADEQERIWDVSYRVKEIQVQDGSHVGLGLGLFLCRTIIERQQGQVGMCSAPGEGSCFWFILPLE
ncbi:sensor histidine kinase [Ktedonospora formicarum]|uniref:histidine kinase n=1 Tax=Ktedonospora formicarum TaxID=2778364 RepID=A0A8J3I6Y7_9CHLR|nr:HAMP domain-containing sensor histidine kinase [Ktedonospora formicarum]GHO46579.1 hypothetical protein KSX_47420 [Ktedonospora formicarum]